MPFIDLSALVGGKKGDDGSSSSIQTVVTDTNSSTPVAIPSEVAVAQQQTQLNANQQLAQTLPVDQIQTQVLPASTQQLPSSPAEVSRVAVQTPAPAVPIVNKNPTPVDTQQVVPTPAMPVQAPITSVAETASVTVPVMETVTPVLNNVKPATVEPSLPTEVPVADVLAEQTQSQDAVALTPPAVQQGPTETVTQKVTFTSTPDADDPDLPDVGAIPEVKIKDGLEIKTEDSGIREVKGPEFDEAEPKQTELQQLESQNLDDTLATANSNMPIEVEPAPEVQVDVQNNAVDTDDVTVAAPANSVEATSIPITDNVVVGTDATVVASPVSSVSDQILDNPKSEATNATAPVAKVEALQETPVVQEIESTTLTDPASGDGGQLQDLKEVSLSTKEYTLNELLKQAIEQGASDLHLTAGYRTLIRVDGKLTQLQSNILDDESIIKLLEVVVKDREDVELSKVRDLDLAYQMPDSKTRFRVNIFRQQGTTSAVFRLIPSKIMTIEELNLPSILNDFTKFSQGLVLVTGPTGSGKSTTIASMLNQINLTEPIHIVTIEDPIEYVYPVGTALVDQREVFGDTESWANALRSVLRQDPDVVLVGEMRDLETIQAAIRTAETGHLVFATLHTNRASQSVDRIIDVFPEHQQSQIRTQLASVLQVVVSQRLVPLTGGGRKAAIEIMVANSAVRNAIRDDKVYQIDNMIQTGADVGMVTMEQSLTNMVKEGIISTEKAQEFANKPADVVTLLGN